jgi:K+-transporting ATPase ATPase C chain
MKKYLLTALKLTAVMIILCAVIYPLLIAAVGRLTSGGGGGVTVVVGGKVVGYENIGQHFSADKYFWGRPSAVNYNAAGSGGSYKGPSNPDYLKDVQSHIDSFLVHNPGVKKEDIPAELVTYSGSGIDPDISPAGARVQIKRVAVARNLPEDKLNDLVDRYTEGPLWGIFGPSRVNVLRLNVALDDLAAK